MQEIVSLALMQVTVAKVSLHNYRFGTRLAKSSRSLGPLKTSEPTIAWVLPFRIEQYGSWLPHLEENVGQCVFRRERVIYNLHSFLAINHICTIQLQGSSYCFIILSKVLQLNQHQKPVERVVEHAAWELVG
jgi:hypothetical protein